MTTKNESGRTMLEMLGVLGIMGILMYGAVTGINYGMSTYKINQAFNDVQDQMQGIMDLYSWSRTYPTRDFTNVACDNDVISNCPCTGSGSSLSCTSSHALGSGGIEAKGKSGGDSFTLTYKNVGKDECSRLKEMEWGTIELTAPTGNCTDSNNMTWEPL